MKFKFISIMLSVVITFSSIISFSSLSVFASDTDLETVYTVAGENKDLFGSEWYYGITDENTMTKVGDLYTYDLGYLQPQDNVRFKIVEHSSDGAQREYGDNMSHTSLLNYYCFWVGEACNVTITFDPDTKEMVVLGDGVRIVNDDVFRVYAYSINSDTLNNKEPGSPYPLKNEMVKGEDGVYSITFCDVQPEKDIKINIIEENYWGIVGFYGYNYCGIDVVTPCDVTVYFEPDAARQEDSRIWAEGEGVVVRDKPLVESMHMVGDFSDNQPTDDNKMSQIDDYVYSYRADNLVVGTDYRFRFESPSGSYIDSWNGNFESEPAQLGVDKEAKVYPNQYKHSSIHFEVPINNASVLISLNLTDYDYITKENATYRIDLVGDIDSDGNMSIKDATRLQKALTDIITLTDVQNSVTDVNNDGVVNVSDVTAIQKMIVG